MFKQYSKPQFMDVSIEKKIERHGPHVNIVRRYLADSIRRLNNVWGLTPSGFYPVHKYATTAMQWDHDVWISSYWYRMMQKTPAAFRYRLHPTHVGDRYALPLNPSAPRSRA